MILMLGKLRKQIWNSAGIWKIWPEASRVNVTLTPSILHQKICIFAQNVTRQTEDYEYKIKLN